MEAFHKWENLWCQIVFHQIAVYQLDGTPLPYNRRQMKIQRIIRDLNGAITSEEGTQLVPDDGIVKYSFTPDENAQFIRVRVSIDVGLLVFLQGTLFLHFLSLQLFNVTQCTHVVLV